MAGYSRTSLVKKLGIKTGLGVYTYNAPENYFEWIDPLPEKTSIRDKLKGDIDFIHLFVVNQRELKSQFIKCKKHLAKDGMMWVSWPKKSSKVETDLDDKIVRKYG